MSHACRLALTHTAATSCLFLLLYQCISVAPLYHLQRCCLYTMWQTIENSIRALAEGAVICWSVARASELCCKVTATPAERIGERDTQHNVMHPSEYLSVLAVSVEHGHISHQASIHFSCLLRGCSSRESVFLNVPASIRSCLCGAPAAGSALCSKRQRERENSIVGASQGHIKRGGGTCRSLFPLCYLYFFFLFPPLIVLDFLRLLATLSRFRAHSSSSPIRPSTIPRCRPYPTSEFSPGVKSEASATIF